MKKLYLFLLSLFISFSSVALASEQLIIEPDAGREPILSAINEAKSSIDLMMYGITDNQFINALINAKKSGRHVQVLLEPHPYRNVAENRFAAKQLRKANIDLQWPSLKFKLIHQKTFLIDQRYAIVMTFNLTKATFKNERNFALIIDDPAMVQEIQQVFSSDWQHKAIATSNNNLIWSPDNSREKILDFIKTANNNIKVYAQDISDYQTIGALAKAARSGRHVEMLMSYPPEKTLRKIEFLRKAGVIVRFSNNYYIHAKVIIVDHSRAILGSINLTRPSLNRNRELSVITQDDKTISQLEKTFNHDWHNTTSLPLKHPSTLHITRLLLRDVKRILPKDLSRI